PRRWSAPRRLDPRLRVLDKLPDQRPRRRRRGRRGLLASPRRCPMSVVAISENMGSLGVEIGHAVAASLGYQVAERDIISKAADRFGEDAGRLSHAVEERPTLVDRLSTAQRRFAQYVEATRPEMAARDDIVLVGLAPTILFARTPHTLRAPATPSEGPR